jgi:hypothetical protein
VLTSLRYTVYHSRGPRTEEGHWRAYGALVVKNIATGQAKEFDILHDLLPDKIESSVDLPPEYPVWYYVDLNILDGDPESTNTWIKLWTHGSGDPTLPEEVALIELDTRTGTIASRHVLPMDIGYMGDVIPNFTTNWVLYERVGGNGLELHAYNMEKKEKRKIGAKRHLVEVPPLKSGSTKGEKEDF